MLSVYWQIVSDGRGNIHIASRLAHDCAPLRKGRRALDLVVLPTDEVTFLVEVVVDRGMDRAEFLQRVHSSESQHRPLSSSEWLV